MQGDHFSPSGHRKKMKMVYSAHFHSIKNYKLKFWGNSSNGATIVKVK
jgi:hypothetical protein